MGNKTCETVHQNVLTLRNNYKPQHYKIEDLDLILNEQQQNCIKNNTTVNKFLDEEFRSNKKASKKIEFQIKNKCLQEIKNPESKRCMLNVKLEEKHNTKQLLKADFIIQKTDSQIFQANEEEKSLQIRSLKVQQVGFQQMKLSKRSSLASYSGQYKSLNIKQSNFVRVKRKNFEFYYELLQKIGQGSFGNVFKVKYIKTGQIRAVKILKNRILKLLNQTQKIHLQLNILKRLDHPNIIKIYDVFYTQEYYYVVTQYCSGGTLGEFFKQKKGNINVKTVKIIIKQLLGALSYLSNQSIIHRDIKLQNIVFDVKPQLCTNQQDIQIKILDFGLAMKAQYKTINKQNPCMGTPNYMAPEVISGKYSFKCDVWSAGVILYYLLSKQFPFQAYQATQMYSKISEENISFTKPCWNFVQTQAIDLIKRMLQKKFLKRISAAQALNSQWLNFNDLQSKRTERELIFTRLQEYKKENNLIMLIQSYLVYLKANDGETKKVIRLFQKIDKDNNGVIDLKEIQQLIPNKNISENERNHIKQLIRKVDKNSSGKIEISEFITILSDRSKLFTQECLEEAFEFLDGNKSGFIEKNELKKALSGCQKLEYETLWKDIDLDSDCKISKQQFMKYLLQFEPLKN